MKKTRQWAVVAVTIVGLLTAADLAHSEPNIAENRQNQPVPFQSSAKVACPFDASKALLPVTCGRLKVPENYDDPSRSVEIAFMVAKARRNLDPESPVLFLNGGPGDVSLHFAEILITSPFIHNVVVDRD